MTTVGDAPVSTPRVAVPNASASPIRVIVGGDLLPHRPSLVGPPAIADALAPLASTFAAADAVIANYEAATGELDPNAKRLVYAASATWIEQLAKSGLHAISVANNHACDLGDSGLDATVAAADRSGLLALGGGSDPWEPRVVAEKNGKKICAVAWTTIVNSEGPCAKSTHLAVAPLGKNGKALVDRAMARARAQCDATIAIMHGGDEYRAQTGAVLDLAAHAAEAGADAVIIHHPHVASPVIVHRTRDGRDIPLFASVGNLVSNQGESWKPPMFPVLRENRRLVCVNAWTRLGVLADLSFRFDGTTPSLEWGEHLVWIENEHADNRAASIPKIEARILDPSADQNILDALSEDRRGPVALFHDPCWLERGPSSDDRCRTTLVHGPALPASIVASLAKRHGKRAH